MTIRLPDTVLAAPKLTSEQVRWDRIRLWVGFWIGWLWWTASASPALAAEPSAGEPNLALHAKYTLHPAPNYHLCTDPADSIQLTDGKTTRDYFWTQPGTVGWNHVPYATITVDLGKVSPIGGVSMTTAANAGGVVWPASVFILTSDDGQTYRLAGDLVALDQAAHGPLPADYAIRQLRTEALGARGRFVRFMLIPPVGGAFLFTDEIQVFRAPQSLRQQLPAGKVIASDQALFAETRLRLAVRHRFEQDAAQLAATIRNAELADESIRHRLQEQLVRVRAQLDPNALDLGPHFRAVLPLNNSHAQLFAVQAALWRAMGRPRFTANTAVTWDPLDAFAAPPARPQRRVAVHALRGEYRAAAVNLYNAGREPIEVHLRFEGLPGGPMPEGIGVQQVEWTDTIRNVAVGAALPDAPRTDAGWTLRVLPGLLRQAWLTFYTQTMPPGNHTGHVVLASRATDQPVRLPLQLQVYPEELPRPTTLWLGGWSYANGRGSYGITPANREAFIRHLRAHFVNAPWANANVLMQFKFDPNQPDQITLDTAELDDWLAHWPDARAYLIFLAAGANLSAGRTEFAGAKAGTPEFDRRVGVWISAWMRHFQSQGVGPERVALLIHDEPWEPSNLTNFFAWTHAIKAAEPKLLIWEDPIYRDPTKAPPALWNVCDVICPNRTHCLARTGRDKFYTALRQRGKTLQYYSCSGPARLLDPYAYYRLQAWQCWRDGGTGSFFWALGDNGGTSSWTEQLAASGPFTPLFLDDTSVTAGKHFEAMRESAEDFETLVLLRKAVDRAQSAGRRDAAVQSAEQLLKTAATEVLQAENADQLQWLDQKDRTVADTVRVRVLEALTALR